MADEQKSKSWWQTIPGIITSITAGITALTGLLVALQQTGWLGRDKPASVARDAVVASSTTPPAPIAPAAPPERARASSSSAPAPQRSAAVPLPELRTYKLGGNSGATFTLLKADLSPQSTEKKALQIRLRMTNHGRFNTNFWDRSFRLLLDDVPIAPDSNLDELVPADSAKEGVVSFSIPRATTTAKLKITYGDDATEIPLDLSAAS
jgi:hypothetical protein